MEVTTPDSTTKIELGIDNNYTLIWLRVLYVYVNSGVIEVDSYMIDLTIDETSSSDDETLNEVDKVPLDLTMTQKMAPLDLEVEMEIGSA